MGKIKELYIRALEDFDDSAEYEFCMWMEEQQKKQKRQKDNSWRSEDQEDDMD